jgi:hypothetical protein
MHNLDVSKDLSHGGYQFGLKYNNIVNIKAYQFNIYITFYVV